VGFRERWASLCWVLALGGGSALFALLPLGGCAFLLATGAPCPGCGMTRSCVALLEGDLAHSMRMHPLGLPLVLVTAAAALMAFREGITGRPVFRRFLDARGTRWALAGVGLLFLVWVIRVWLHSAWSPDPIRPDSPAARLLR